MTVDRGRHERPRSRSPNGLSAIRSADGAVHEILRRCLNGDVEPLIGKALFLEYEDVLSRDQLFEGAGIDAEERSALLDAVLKRL